MLTLIIILKNNNFMSNIFSILFKTIKKNKKKNPQTSYTSFLFKKGINFCLEKFKEEFLELIDAFKKKNKKNIIHESADLIYHLLILLETKKINIKKVFEELKKRRRTSGIEEKLNRKKNVR
jgi:phosphoribosyl-ATP pyrophosphohydrolase